jgi:hypothetical protein
MGCSAQRFSPLESSNRSKLKRTNGQIGALRFNPRALPRATVTDNATSVSKKSNSIKAKGTPMKKCKFLLVVAAVAGLPGVSTLAIAQSRNALSIADNDGIYVDGLSFKVIPGNAKGDGSALIRQMGARDLGPAAIIFRKGNKLYVVAADPLDQQSYGSDRRDYGSDRRDYGSDRDENPSTAQSEREWREWQQSLRQNRNRRDYGSDRNLDYGSDRRDYGSDRDENPSTAQSEREWREWQESLRRNNNRRDYGSDRRDYGSDRYAAYASDRGAYGSSNRSDCASDRRNCGTDQRYFGSDRRDYASDRRDYTDRYPGESGHVTDPDYAEYRLRKFFDQNWTTSETR